MKGAALAIVVMLTASTAHAWQSSVDTSPVDDSRRVVVTQMSKTMLADRFGKPTASPNLQILCEENRTVLAFVFPGFWLSDLRGNNATLRVDKKPARKLSMIESSDHESLGLLGGNAIREIKGMLGGTNLFVRVVPVNESAKEVWFDIAGIDAAVKPVREACGW